MTILVGGTQPNIAGNLVLTTIVSYSPDISIATANTLSTTGIFVYSNIRIPLANVVSDSFSRASQPPTIISTPITRQILIR